MIQLNHLPSSWDDLPDWPPWANLLIASTIGLIKIVVDRHLFITKESDGTAKTILQTNTNNNTYTNKNNYKNTKKSDGVVFSYSDSIPLLSEDSSANVISSIYKCTWYIYALAFSNIKNLSLLSNIVSSVSSHRYFDNAKVYI